MNKKLKLWELDRLSEEAFKKQKKFPISIVLDDIRSLNNIGSFFRTADAFNISKVYLCGFTAQPPHRDIHKTALGATNSVKWEYHSDIVSLVKDLKKEGKTICAIEQTENTIMLNHIDSLQTDHVVLVFGNEVNGVNQEVVNGSNEVIEIPQFGTKHSLNVSVCAGIVLWEFTKKHIP